MDRNLFALLVLISATFLSAEGRICHSYNYLCRHNCSSTPFQTCKTEDAKCISLYSENRSQGTSKLLLKSCWQQNDEICSPTSECNFHRTFATHGLKRRSFLICCCTGDKCNSSSPGPAQAGPAQAGDTPSDTKNRH